VQLAKIKDRPAIRNDTPAVPARRAQAGLVLFFRFHVDPLAWFNAVIEAGSSFRRVASINSFN
jgi:hypothetical protein